LGGFCHEASVLTFHFPSSPRYTFPFYKSRTSLDNLSLGSSGLK
jgi:hypothetical protein